MESKLLCKKCGTHFIVDEATLDIAADEGLTCTECGQIFSEDFIVRLRQAFEAVRSNTGAYIDLTQKK